MDIFSSSKLKILENFIWLLITAPLYVRVVKYESPRILMTLVSLFVWFSLAMFLLGLFFHNFNVPSSNWFSEIAKNPRVIVGKPFILAIIILSLFYLQATLRDLWDEKEIKKSLQGKN